MKCTQPGCGGTITDGYCDVVRVRRNHAWLVPAGRALPFTPKGPVFSLM